MVCLLAYALRNSTRSFPDPTHCDQEAIMRGIGLSGCKRGEAGFEPRSSDKRAKLRKFCDAPVAGPPCADTMRLLIQINRSSTAVSTLKK